MHNFLLSPTAAGGSGSDNKQARDSQDTSQSAGQAAGQAAEQATAGENKQRRGRGFAGMDPQRQREIASQGGRAAHQQGVAHKWDSREAARAGQLGGLASRGGQGAAQGGDQGGNPGGQGGKQGGRGR